jgi:hypothetical protein
MRWKIAGWCFAIFLVAGVVSGFLTNTGWLVLWMQLLALGLFVAACPCFVVYGSLLRRLEQQEELMAERARQLKVDIATAEAQLGIDVPTEGACPACYESLVLGACYCTRCRQPVGAAAETPGLPLLLCPACWERQPAGSAYCWHCGADLGASQAASDAGDADLAAHAAAAMTFGFIERTRAAGHESEQSATEMRAQEAHVTYTSKMLSDNSMMREECTLLRPDLEAAGVPIPGAEEPEPGMFWLVNPPPRLRSP